MILDSIDAESVGEVWPLLEEDVFWLNSNDIKIAERAECVAQALWDHHAARVEDETHNQYNNEYKDPCVRGDGGVIHKLCRAVPNLGLGEPG